MKFLRSTKAWQTSHKGKFYQKMPNFWSHALIHQEKKENKKQLTVWDTLPTVCSVIPTLLNHKYNEKGEARGEGGKEKRSDEGAQKSSVRLTALKWNNSRSSSPPGPLTPAAAV